MRVGVFRFLTLCLLALALVAFVGCKARQASSANDLAATGSGAAANSSSDSAAGAYASSDEVVVAQGGKLKGNSLVFRQGPGGQPVRYVYGVRTDGNEEVSGNKLTISGGNILESAYGGYTEGWAKNNKVTVTSGDLGRRAEGGHGRQGSQGNELIFEGGKVENAYGGYSSDGPADNNRLVVSGGLISDDAQAGLSLRSSASGNTLVVEGGVIEDQAYGGYGMEGPATKNTTIVSGGVIKGDAQGAVSSTHQATGNTLILRGSPQIGGSLYGAFAVGERGDNPDDVTGNKILFEGYSGDLTDMWNAEEVRIDKNSRISNRIDRINVYDCVNFINDGVIVLGERAQAYLEIGKYSGKGSFEVDIFSLVKITAKALNAPLRIKIDSSESLKPFDRNSVALVELSGAKFGRGLNAGNAVQLLNTKVGGLTLRLEHELNEEEDTHYWYLSGE